MNPEEIDDLELLTKARAVLDIEGFELAPSVWWTENLAALKGQDGAHCAGCLIGVGLHAFRLAPVDIYSRSVTGGGQSRMWDQKAVIQVRLANLLAPHLDFELAEERLPQTNPHYTVSDLRTPNGRALDVITIYSDYVLAGMPDAVDRARELYSKAIAQILESRVEYRAGIDIGKDQITAVVVETTPDV